MADIALELRDLLSHHLLGHPYDPSSTHREKFLIDHLVEQYRWWEVGSVTYQELRDTFAQHNLGNFDLDAWITSKAEEDEIDLPSELGGP